MTVYAVQIARRREAVSGRMVPHFDLTPAKEYGEVIELLAPLAKPYVPEPLVLELRDKLRFFSDDDYIVCIGNPILIAMAVNVAASVNEGRVKALQWQTNYQKYLQIDLQL